MWYIIIRIIIGLIIGSILFFILKKSKIKKNFLCFFLSFFIALISSYILYCIPIENLFVDFSSPEKAFNYLYSGNIKKTIDGESSTMILYTKNNVHSQAIIPKNNNNWKLDIFQLNNSIAAKTVNRHIINIYNARNTDDYYITIWDSFTDHSINVTDNENSKFQYIIEENRATADKNIIYYAYIKGIEKNYSITIDGEKISLFN